MKKLLIISGAIVVIIIGSFLFIQWRKTNDPKYDFNQCVKNGGKTFGHSMGDSCEKEAKDSGKQCEFDDECDKNNCVYQDEKSNYGKCDDYLGDNDGIKNCHYPRKNGKVMCVFEMS